MKNTKVNKPITKGVCKVPVIMQLEALECGAASLCMVLAYYSKWVPLEQVRVDCGVSRDGSTAKNILKAARNYGLTAKGYRYNLESLRKEGTFPCIIHWNFNHFVVLNGFRGNKAYLNDPARGTYSVSLDIFEKSYTGICLRFEPSENFVPFGKQKSMVDFAVKRLKNTGSAVLFALLTSVILSVFSIITPGFSRVFLDRLLTKQNPEWVTPFFVIFGVFCVLQVITEFIQITYQFKLNAKLACVGESSYLWKVLCLPIDFFSQRMAGDIQGRKTTNAQIASTLINTFSPLVLKMIMMVLYFVVMIRTSWILTLVGLFSFFINGLVSNIISRKRINVTRVSTRDSAKLQAASVAGIEMIETIKSSGAENGFFSKWSGYQASANSQKVKFEKINVYLGLIPSFVSTLTDNIVLILGVYLTIHGHFTVGMIMQFQGFLNLFMSPAQMLISAGQTLQEMRTQMEKIDDVMEYPEDNVFLDEPLFNDLEYDKLSGSIEIKDVVFGYSKLSDPLIKGFNLSLTPGKSVAIVGGSGCGKSTISKLIAGLYQPWSGEILFDGKKMSEIDKSIFKTSVAVVDQDIILFEDTIMNNIKMWDDSIKDFEVILAAKDAQLHDDIMQRKGGYEYKLSENGKDFSGGQRQRMEIARVLAQDPTIIIMDEATSALDAKTEYDVVKSIRRRGITCIVVAHRLSTIRSCDEIIVMKKGEIIDRGTHSELFERCDYYHSLVTNE